MDIGAIPTGAAVHRWTLINDAELLRRSFDPVYPSGLIDSLGSLNLGILAKSHLVCRSPTNPAADRPSAGQALSLTIKELL
jgi:hypothetical protein